MQKNIYSFTLLFVVAFCMTIDCFGQSCTGAVPANAIVVTSMLNTVDDATYWICDGGDIDALGPNGGEYYIENGGRLELIGNGHTVYVKDGGVVEVIGNGNTLYVALGAQVQVNGNENTIYGVMNADVTDGGMDNMVDLTTCSSVEISYIDASPNGCATSSVASSEKENQGKLSVSVLQGKVFGVFIEQCAGNTEGVIEIFDAEGKDVMSEEIDQCHFKVDLSHQSSGVYWFSFRDRRSEQVYIRQVVLVQ